MIKLQKVKDTLLSKSLIKIINLSIKDYGKLTSFVLNSQNKTIHFTILLKGESDFIKIEIINYSFIIDKDISYLKFDKIISSRVWINLLINNYMYLIIMDKQIEIPQKIAKALKVII